LNERRLLERIAHWEIGEERTSTTRVDVLVQSIMKHLSCLLNTRQGSVQLDPKFGVPDFTNIAGGLANGSVSDVEDELCRMVKKYEPRISSPKISLTPDTSDLLSLKFELEGILDVDDRSIPLHLATVVGASGKVSIS
jgi:type VI secretion system protein